MKFEMMNDMLTIDAIKSHLCGGNCASGENVLIVRGAFSIVGLDCVVESSCVICIVCEAGQMSVAYDNDTVTISRSEMAVLMHGHVAGRFFFSDDFIGMALIFSKAFSSSVLGGNCYSVKLETEASPVTPLSPESIEGLRSFFMTCESVIGREESLCQMIGAFFLGRRKASHLSDSGPSPSEKSIVAKFMGHLDADFTEHRKLDFYADLLSVSPKYLSRVLRRYTGKSFSEWLDRKTMAEAKSELVDTELSVAQISENLGFADTPSFSRYFKRIEGVSPIQYRKEH